MADNMIERILPGATVDCTDGRLGTVDSLEPDGLVVTRGWTDQKVLVPFDFVEHVTNEGSVQLTCPRDELGQLADAPAGQASPAIAGQEARWTEGPDLEQTIELKEEQLVAHKDMREVGQVQIRTEVEEVPGRLEVEAFREEVEVEHVPVGQVVTEKVAPWEEDGVLIVPVYEEQLVLTKRLVLREHLRVRRVETSERQLFEDTLKRERLVVEDPNNTGLVHERFPLGEDGEGPADRARDKDDPRRDEGGFLEKVVRKAFE
jgi:uncharacterized protein (TIGR02271 family)